MKKLRKVFRSSSLIGLIYLLSFPQIYGQGNLVMLDSLHGVFLDNCNSWHETSWSEINRYDASGNQVVWIKSLDDETTEGMELNAKWEKVFTTSNKVLYVENYIREASGWIATEKETYEYSDDESTVAVSQAQWAANNSGWINAHQKVYTYLADGRLVEMSFLLWDDELNLWDSFIQTDHSFTDFGAPSISTRQVWIENQWSDNWITNYAYNSAGDLLEENYVWYIPMGVFGSETAKSYSYDEAQNSIEVISSETEDENLPLQNQSKLVTIYSNDNLPILETQYYWNVLNSAWDLHSQLSNEYSSSNQLVESTFEEWNGVNNQWELLYHRTWTFDAIGNLLTYVDRRYFENENMNYQNETVYEYDMDYLLSEIVLPEEFLTTSTWEHCVNKVLGFKTFNTGIFGAETLLEEQQLFYSDFSTGIRDVSSPEVAVFPNPTSDFLEVKLGDIAEAKLEIYDLQGRLCFASEVRNQERVSLGVLASGIYAYRVLSDDVEAMGKLVIQQ